MENNQVLKDRVEWPLLFSQRNKLSLEVHILPPIEYIEGSEIDLSIPSKTLPPSDKEPLPNRVKLFESDIILGILQDVFYVTRLDWLDRRKKANKDSEEIQVLNQRDDYWNILRFIWNKLMNLIYDNLEDFKKDESSEDLNKTPRKNSWSEETFFSSLGQPFALRYEIYRLLSIFTASKNPREIARIVGNFDKFVEFWNKSMDRFSLMVQRIQKYKVDKLERHFDNILKKYGNDQEYKKFNKEFLQEGCFSKMTVLRRSSGRTQDVLCFNGVNEYDINSSEIGKAIYKIKIHGNFKDPIVIGFPEGKTSISTIEIPKNIRYDLIGGRFILYKDALKYSCFSSTKLFNRMFTCCERKTFAGYNHWKDCKKFRMVIKLAPCELCVNQVVEYRKRYGGEPLIIGRNKNKSLPNKYLYDILANCIYIHQVGKTTCP